MKKVFVSSVQTGFESYRAASRRAIELLKHRPIMFEDFGARNMSPQQACQSEVEQADIFVLVLGEKYGYTTATGKSVCEEEFDAAVRANKPILVFTQNSDMEEEQQHFRERIEDYGAGFFRASFDTPEDLKDEIIAGIQQLASSEPTITEGEFTRLVHEAEEHIFTRQHSHVVQVISALLPQPEHAIDIIAAEEGLDKCFVTLCQANLAVMSKGYEKLSQPDWTGLRWDEHGYLAFFENGLILISSSPNQGDDLWGFNHYFAPPSRIKKTAIAASLFCDAGSAWCYLGLRNMANITIEEPPSPKPDSITLSTGFGLPEQSERTGFLQPFNQDSHEHWVSQSIARLQRIYRKG